MSVRRAARRTLERASRGAVYGQCGATLRVDTIRLRRACVLIWWSREWSVRMGTHRHKVIDRERVCVQYPLDSKVPSKTTRDSTTLHLDHREARLDLRQVTEAHFIEPLGLVTYMFRYDVQAARNIVNFTKHILGGL